MKHSKSETEDKPRAEHAVVSAFDLFSIGVGPSRFGAPPSPRSRATLTGTGNLTARIQLVPCVRAGSLFTTLNRLASSKRLFTCVSCLDASDASFKVHNIKITLYGSLAATGKGHHTPQVSKYIVLLFGL